MSRRPTPTGRPRRALATAFATCAGLALTTLLALAGPARADADRAAAPAADGSAAADTAATGPAAVVDTGWWTRRPGAAALPASFFEVASGIDGDESVAALRVVTSGPLTSATLTVGESGGTATNTAAMRVCATAGAWTASNAGPFASAPAADCTDAIALTRDAKGTWTADVTSLLAAGDSRSLMVVPKPDPLVGLLPPTWTVQLSPARVVATAAPAAAPTGDVPATTVPAAAAVPAGTGVAVTPYVAPTPAVSPRPAGGAPAAATAPARATAATTGTVESAAAPATVTVASTAKPKHWGRLVLYVPLAAAGGAAAVVLRRRLSGRA